MNTELNCLRCMHLHRIAATIATKTRELHTAAATLGRIGSWKSEVGQMVMVHQSKKRCAPTVMLIAVLEWLPSYKTNCVRADELKRHGVSKWHAPDGRTAVVAIQVAVLPRINIQVHGR